MTTLVICGDGDVDEFGWRIGITECDDGNVDVGGLLDSLGVSTGIGHNDEAGLFERASDVVGEVARRESPGNGDSTSVGGEFENSALTVRTSRDDSNVGWVVDGCNDASC